jgi:LacI family transcriptional regulator
MTTYLLSLGHRRIAFIKGHPRHGAARLRLQGYKDALEAGGLQSYAALIKDGNFRFQAGVDAAEQLLRQKVPPTAIFAANDEMAAGVLTAAHRMGIAIPDALSVAGFDDIFYASVTWPGLTTIRQPIAEMGDGAADLLLAQLRKNKAVGTGASSLISFKHELKIRESTGPAPK